MSQDRDQIIEWVMNNPFEAADELLALRQRGIPKSTRCPRCDGSMMEEGEGRDRHLRCRQCTHEQPLEGA